jgi:hypothetical protein
LHGEQIWRGRMLVDVMASAARILRIVQGIDEAAIRYDRRLNPASCGV